MWNVNSDLSPTFKKKKTEPAIHRELRYVVWVFLQYDATELLKKKKRYNVL